MSRARFTDFGRWTAGTWTTDVPGVWFAIGYVYTRDVKPYGVCGPAITIGRRTWAVCARHPRAEYKARKDDPWATENEEFRPLPRARKGRWWR
ncbi:hypothetical protein [Streptomyces boncukensis]|uniref:Uncharacterized protein n=1 Tax=Streptomyces boncukensis TaxID=2711219 RepID=A0A6G4WP85_9ACTN|nr:hypothetical protein [Streptomyces boncukensis]NGO67015.1 hypothetical protein [Streptomyces boncukensis]